MSLLPAAAGAPDFESFKERINPIFYKRASDGLACANCHASHDKLQLVEPPPDAKALAEEDIRVNFEYVLRVIDRTDPERSLLVRKPRSPYGRGDDDAESPTGLTHRGGDRWANTDGSVYETLVKWIRGIP